MPDTEPVSLPKKLKAKSTQLTTKKPRGVPIEQIIEYKLKGLTSADIGKLLGVCDSDVRVRLMNHSEDIDNTDLFRKHRAKVFAFQARRILQAINDADIEKASLRDKVIAASVLYDKERLESGLSTQNLVYIDLIKAKQTVASEMQTIEAELVEAGIDPKKLSESGKEGGESGDNCSVEL
jgi:hypothetical protein